LEPKNRWLIRFFNLPSFKLGELYFLHKKDLGPSLFSPHHKLLHTRGPKNWGGFSKTLSFWGEAKTFLPQSSPFKKGFQILFGATNCSRARKRFQLSGTFGRTFFTSSFLGGEPSNTRGRLRV